MASDNPKKSGGDLAQPKRPPPSTSSSAHKPRRENLSPKPGPNPSPKPAHFSPHQHQQQPGPHRHHPLPPPIHEPPPPLQPIYGFQMLERRTIALIDGTVRSYFALPRDYQDVIAPRFMFGPDNPMKRKWEADLNGFSRHSHYGNVGPSGSPFRRVEEEELRPSKAMRFGGGGGGGEGSSSNSVRVKVSPEIMKAFLHYVKLIYEYTDKKMNFLDDGKHAPIRCLACGGSSKIFPDVHSLVMHAYNSDNADSRVDHLGLHRALCALMGWNCMRAPDNSKVYQILPPDEAAAFQDDLILWPPMVIIYNANTGKTKDGRIDGLGNKALDGKLRDLGFSGGKSRALYNREGHLGISIIKFTSDLLGLKEAMRLSDHFEKDRHGRREWAHLQSTGVNRDDENNPNIATIDERTGKKTRILYGYLLTASDLDKVDSETRKKAAIESKFEKLHVSK